MTTSQGTVSRDEAITHFEIMLSALKFQAGGTNTRILRALFELWKGDPDAGLSGTELFGRLGSNLAIIEDSLRPAIGKLRLRLAAYNDRFKKPVRFQVSFGPPYQLLVSPSQTQHHDFVPIIFGRGNPIDPFEEIICGESEDVLFVGIASQQAFGEHIEPWFDKGRIKAKHFRVLTWRPKSDDVIDLFANHIGISKRVLIRNIRGAWENWKQLENDHETTVEVYGYSSPPALAVSNDEIIKVEMIPFNGTADGGRDWLHRPSIVLNTTDHPRGFEYFRKWFDDLWFSAMLESIRDPQLDSQVHRYWRDRRKAILEKRGLL
jgi:hypothetical protein